MSDAVANHNRTAAAARRKSSALYEAQGRLAQARRNRTRYTDPWYARGHRDAIRWELAQCAKVRELQPRPGEHVADWTKRVHPETYAAIMAGTEGYN